jgi:hypothetical protein
MKIHELAALCPTHDHLARVVRLPWSSSAVGCMPANDEHAHIKRMTTDRRAVVPGVRSCNRHADCDEADIDTLLGHGRRADHCHEEFCEDCFGY